MTTELGGAADGHLALDGLRGLNPLGFLAALGVLEAAGRFGLDLRLGWTDELRPRAVVSGVADLDVLVDALDDERQRWLDSDVLLGTPEHRLTDAKPRPRVLRAWAKAIGAAARDTDADGGAEQAMFTALVAEGAYDGKGAGKPTHLHFSAGQQQFLRLAADLARDVDREQLRVAVTGPWVGETGAKTFNWNVGGDRLYAFRATNPAGEQRPGYPGPDWLAFRGLAFLPVIARPGRNGLGLVTTACESRWKTSGMRWPLWSVTAGRDEVLSLIGSLPQPRPGEPADLSAWELTGRGITRVLRAPITRSDQGGYGSFGGANQEFDGSTDAESM